MLRRNCQSPVRVFFVCESWNSHEMRRSHSTWGRKTAHDHRFSQLLQELYRQAMRSSDFTAVLSFHGTMPFVGALGGTVEQGSERKAEKQSHRHLFFLLWSFEFDRPIGPRSVHKGSIARTQKKRPTHHRENAHNADTIRDR